MIYKALRTEKEIRELYRVDFNGVKYRVKRKVFFWWVTSKYMENPYSYVKADFNTKLEATEYISSSVIVRYKNQNFKWETV